MDSREKQTGDSPAREETKATPAEDTPPPPRRSPRQPRPYADPVDDALDDSFPASDPPSWAGR